MTDEYPLAEKVAVVTGASRGMGRIIATTLARAGARVIAVARHAESLGDLKRTIPAGGTPGSLDIVTGDLSHRSGVVSAASAISGRHEAVHLLINNAGAHFERHRRSPDGIEMNVAVNYLAAYGMTVLLGDRLRRGHARIVNVSSDTIRDARKVTWFGRPRPVALVLEDLDRLSAINPEDTFAGFQAYARAKLLMVVAGNGLAHSFSVDGVTINAVHPGVTATGMVDDLTPAALRPLGGVLRHALLTPEDGAQAALRLALDESMVGITGCYFVREQAATTPLITSDLRAQKLLLERSDHFFTAMRSGLAAP